jgi:RimJ/RimL family protein N-acetyltransferase
MKNSFEILFKDLRDLGMTNVKASVKVDNFSSLKMAEKVGFKVCETIYKNNEPYYFVLQKSI